MKKIFKNKMITVLALLLTTLSGASYASDSLLINGAGATFPYPLYSKWFHEYRKTHPKYKFNYQSIGSGGGIRQITANTVDFGASDAPMKDKEMAKLSESLLHIPTVLGAVVVAYNQPNIGDDLKLTGTLVADIFLGKIKKWNDPQITALNPDKRLPDQDILVAHRSDGSGTTYVFTDYLSKVSSTWKNKIGTGKAVNWPTGLGAKGNEGVTGLIRQTPGALGYVELGYAMKNKLSMASLKNKAGNFIRPSIDSISEAAAGVKMPADYRVSLTDPNGEKAYPISSFTYLLVYRNQKETVKGKALVNFLKWAVHEGQKMASPLFYAPLPNQVVERIDKTIAHITISPRKN